MNTDIEVFPADSEEDRQWLNELWQAEWSGDIMVSRGHVYRLADLQALVGKANGELVGAATYRFDDANGCELMSINATSQGGGVGTQLLKAVENEARLFGCRRVWLITSNDNIDALRFYQRRCYRITTVHRGAIDEAGASSRRFRSWVSMASIATTRSSWPRLSKEVFDVTEIETERLLLRPYTMNDLDFIASLWADPKVVRYSGEGVTRDRDEAEERLQRIIVGYESGYGLLAAWHKAEKRLVGHLGLVRQEVDGKSEIELGYWLARDFWGQGLATEAALALRAHAFHVLGRNRIISLIQPGNVASIAVAERIGMNLEREATFKGQAVRIYSMYPDRAGGDLVGRLECSSVQRR